MLLKLNMKGQSSIEAAMLLTMMLFAFTIFMGVSSEKIVETQATKDRQLAEDLASVIEAEFRLAASAEDGYYRVFELPVKLAGRDYEVKLLSVEDLRSSGVAEPDHSEIVIKFTNDYLAGYERVITLPRQVNGSMCGFNMLQKIKGTVNVTCNCVSGYRDKDGDGYTTAEVLDTCGMELPAYYKTTPSASPDCNDDDSTRWQYFNCYPDRDRDTYTTAAEAACKATSCTSPPDLFLGAASGNDCDDTNPAVWQLLTCYQDNDGDGYGEGTAVPACRAGKCTPPQGFSGIGTNCGSPDYTNSNSINCFTTTC